MTIALAADLDDINIRFISALVAMETMLRQAGPDRDELGKRRVALARAASERLRFIHARLCPTLAAGPTPRHADAARHLRERLTTMIGASNKHIGEWSMARIAADWAGYGAATRALAAEVRALLAMERRDIYPLLATAAARG